MIDLQCTPKTHLHTALAINRDSQLPTRGQYTTYEYLPIYTVLPVIDLQCTPSRHLNPVLEINWNSLLLKARSIQSLYEYLPMYTVLPVIDLHCSPTTHLDTVGNQLRQSITNARYIHNLWILPIYTVLSVRDLHCTPTTHLDTVGNQLIQSITNARSIHNLCALTYIHCTLCYRPPVQSYEVFAINWESQFRMRGL